MDIFTTGMLSPKYEAMPFSQTENWGQAINRYHAIHSALIQKQINTLLKQI